MGTQLSLQQNPACGGQWLRLCSVASYFWCAARLCPCGPYLFLVYINEIVDAILEDSKIVMFADDIALYRTIRSPLDFILLQLDVDAICNWIALNYLKLNILKCCYMIFTRKRYPTLPTTPLLVNNLALAKVDSFKYLGVNLSTNLSWSEHVNCIAMKTRRLVGLLYR